MTELKLKMIYSHNKNDNEEAKKHIGEYVLFGCDYFDLIGTSGKLIDVTEDSFNVESSGKIFISSCIAFIDMVV